MIERYNCPVCGGEGSIDVWSESMERYDREPCGRCPGTRGFITNHDVTHVTSHTVKFPWGDLTGLTMNEVIREMSRALDNHGAKETTFKDV